MTLKAIEILPRLFTRGDLCKSTPESACELIERIQLDQIICLAPTPAPWLAQYVHYAHWPLTDGKYGCDEGRVEWITNHIVDSIRGGENVLVHCHAGRNRTGLIATRVVAEINRSTNMDALEYVRGLRPRSVANPAMIEYLQRLDEDDD